MRGGDCVLCYYSSVLRCIVGISEPFKVGNTVGTHILYTQISPIMDVNFSLHLQAL